MLPFCYLDVTLGAFALPTAQQIRAKRVVVVTCGAAGLLREAFATTPQDPLITFTHVLIDEAGQVGSLHLSGIRWLSKSSLTPSALLDKAAWGIGMHRNGRALEHADDRLDRELKAHRFHPNQHVSHPYGVADHNS